MCHIFVSSTFNKTINAADSGEVELSTDTRRQKVSKHNFGQFRLSEQKADCSDRLASYGFLLVFCNDLRSRLSREVKASSS